MPPLVRLAPLLVLTACQTTQLSILPQPEGPSPTMAAAPLPEYRVGDRYYFDNNTTIRVGAIDQEQIQWIDNRKRVSVAFRNFALRTLFSESATKTYEAYVHTQPNAIWPLNTSQSVRYKATTTTTTKSTGIAKSYEQTWSCAVDGTETVRVLAGTFDTYRVTCTRFYGFPQKVGQRRTWWYAPALGHFVRQLDFYKASRKSIVKELTGVLPALREFKTADRQRILLVMQRALENRTSGETETWSSNTLGIKVAVTPTGTFQTPTGKFCRNFAQTITFNKEAPRNYPGVACREGKLNWRLPRKR